MSELTRQMVRLLQEKHARTKALAPDRIERRSLPIEIDQYRVLGSIEAAAFCGLSVPHWRRLYRAGKVPKPIKLSVRKLGWRAIDLIDWLQTRLDSS